MAFFNINKSEASFVTVISQTRQLIIKPIFAVINCINLEHKLPPSPSPHILRPSSPHVYYSSWRTPALLPRAIFTQHGRHINGEPQSPAAPNSKLRSIWITDYIPLSLPFLPLAAPLSRPSTRLPSLHLYPHSHLFFPHHFTDPAPPRLPPPVSCPSIIHISSPKHLGSTRCASLQSGVIAC